MQYIFEDCRTSLLATLFRARYSTEVCSNFHYTNGNSKIAGYITSKFKTCKEIDLSVFLDMPPGNPNIVRIYNDLVELSKDYKNMIVFPLVCMEFYYLKSLQNMPTVIERSWYDTCVNFGLARETCPLIPTDDKAVGLYNFESFCKLVAKKALMQCARIGEAVKGEGKYRPYFEEDCLCGTSFMVQGCLPYTVFEKSQNLVAQLPVRPAFLNDPLEHVATYEERVKLHKKLIEDYNTVSEKMKSRDENRSEFYVRAMPMFY